MDDKDGIGSQTLPKKGRGAINRNILVFAFFLVLSFLFWYLNSLSKEIETDIKYPVRYVNLPTNRVLNDSLPSRLTLILKGPGYSILNLKVTGKSKPVVIDFTKITYRQIPSSESNRYYLVSAGLISSFNTQFKSVCKVISVKPDTIFFSFRQNVK